MTYILPKTQDHSKLVKCLSQGLETASKSVETVDSSVNIKKSLKLLIRFNEKHAAHAAYIEVLFLISKLEINE